MLALAPGLDDALFEHDGQLTKREVRAVTLSALAPRQGELLWDVGLGAGSIAIEWLLRHPSLKAIGIEAEPQRAARAARNAAVLGTPDLQIMQKRAPEAFAGLPSPDAMFLDVSMPGMNGLDVMAQVKRMKPALAVVIITGHATADELEDVKRMGAVDVTPFVPIEGVTMADCVALARRVGAELAERFALPIYLYEEAASTPARRNLEDIRRGEFEGLAEKMKEIA